MLLNLYITECSPSWAKARKTFVLPSKRVRETNEVNSMDLTFFFEGSLKNSDLQISDDGSYSHFLLLHKSLYNEAFNLQK